MSEKILNELMGTLPFDSRITQQPTDTSLQSSVSQNKPFTFNLSHCNNLRGFQLDIIGALSAQRDIFVVSKPGSGKTLPIICYWANNILGLSVLGQPANIGMVSNVIANLVYRKGQNVKRIIWLVPTRQLVDQTVEEFVENITTLIYQYFNLCFENTGFGRGAQTINETSIQIFRRYIKPFLSPLKIPQESLKYIEHLFELHLTGRQDTTKEISNLFGHILDQLEKNIKQFVKQNLINAMSGVHSQGNPRAPIQIAIYESFASFAKGKGKEILKDVRLLVVDEAHWLQHSGQDYDTDTRYLKILESVAKVLQSMNKRNYQIVFLSGTINPNSAESITSLLDKCIGSNFVIKVTSAKNPSQITILPDDRLVDLNYISNLAVKLISSNRTGVAIVLFSKNKIRTVVENISKRLSIKTSQHEKPSGPGYHDGLYVSDYTSRYHGQKQLPLDYGNIRDKYSPANISNEKLREAVLRGIGWIFRLPDDAPPQERKDNAIVANLFTKGKIKVLLCTDAVGIGMNIKIREMYIPYIEKYSDFTKNNIEISLRELAQIVHRTGRDPNVVGTIYTPSDNIDKIIKALNASPKDFPNVQIDYKTMTKYLKCSQFRKMFARIMVMLKSVNMNVGRSNSSTSVAKSTPKNLSHF